MAGLKKGGSGSDRNIALVKGLPDFEPKGVSERGRALIKGLPAISPHFRDDGINLDSIPVKPAGPEPS